MVGPIAVSYVSDRESENTSAVFFRWTEELDSSTGPVEEDLPSGPDDEAES